MTIFEKVLKIYTICYWMNVNECSEQERHWFKPSSACHGFMWYNLKPYMYIYLYIQAFSALKQQLFGQFVLLLIVHILRWIIKLPSPHALYCPVSLYRSTDYVA